MTSYRYIILKLVKTFANFYYGNKDLAYTYNPTSRDLFTKWYFFSCFKENVIQKHCKFNPKQF